MSEIDWDAVRDEVTVLLQDLIRIDTTNPPGNETQAAEYISEVLGRDGIESIITESEPDRGNVTARLAGGPEPPRKASGLADHRHPEQDVHEGGLAGAVLSDQRVDLPGLEVEVHLRQDAVPVEVLRDGRKLEDGGGVRQVSR